MEKKLPEGPEIQIAADKIARVLEHQTLERVEIPWSPLQDFASSWAGLKIKKIRARGKALLTYLENGDIFYSHNQLYGRWLTRRTHQEPKSNRSLRIALFTDKGSAFLYSATDLEVLQESDLVCHPYLSRLGPDVLDEDTSVAQVSRRLRSKAFRNRQLASLYLDQRFLAGPGNYLRSEILFCSGLYPRAKPNQLESKQITNLARQTLKICQRAYEKKGITVEAKIAQALKKEGWKKRQYRHYAFGREGKLCRVCQNDTIVKVPISSRSVFYCPSCQPEP